MAQACCKEAQECSTIEGCAQIEACIRACGSGDTLCRFKCSAGNGAAAPLQQGLESCRATHCAKECLPAPWACLGQVKWQYPSLRAQTITIKTTAVCASCGPGGGHAPLAGTIVRLCSLADPKCDLPLAGSTADGSGAVILKVDTSLYPPPLAAYLEYRKAGYLDTLAHLNMPPIWGDQDLGPMVLLDPKVNVAAFASMLGTTYDPSRAVMGVFPVDCNGQPATKTVTVTWLDRDDRTASTPYFAYTGGAHAVNLPINAAGITRIVTRVAETNQLVSATNAVVRAGAASFVGPSPTSPLRAASQITDGAATLPPDGFRFPKALTDRVDGRAAMRRRCAPLVRGP